MTDSDKQAKRLALLEEENRQLQRRLKSLTGDADHYRSLVESATDAIFVGNQRGRLLFVNDSAVTLTGYSRSELLTMDLGGLFSNQEMSRLPLKYDLLEQGKIVKKERYITRKDGTEIPVEMSSRKTGGRYYHCFMRDISERKKAEEVLRISEAKFSQIFHLSPDSIALTSLEDGKLIDVNEVHCEISGWKREEIIGQSVLSKHIDFWRNREDRERLVRALKEKGEVLGLEARFRGKGGKIITGLLSARIIEINNEQCILTITKDISDWKSLQNKQQKLEEQMLQVQKLESLGVLAGGIAHDFNNILMAVIGHCELAQRRLPDTSPALKHLQQVNLAAGRAAELANQMLAYSGKGKFVVEAVDLTRIIREMEHIISVSVSKRASLRYELTRNLPSIEADATQLRQIIMNLVINASDALEDKDGTIVIATGFMECSQVELEDAWSDKELPEGTYVYLRVTDSGCGIDPKVVKRIFEPFFSTKFTGRGLGMAAVSGIVRGHHGAIKVTTDIGRGSSFTILFPASTLLPISKTIATKTSSLHGSGLVLLVDDEESVRTIGSEMLENFGFTTITASNGEEALTIFREKHAEIVFVLMDLTMPRMGGDEAFQKIRQIDPEAKVIICSGYSEQEVAEKFAGEGFFGFLKKPYRLDSLQTMIQQITQKV